jgi:peptidoglycan hydrolase CwlO-like protein
MKIRKWPYTIISVIILSGFFLFLMGYKSSPISADVSCPVGMNNSDCLVYLQNQYSEIQKQQGSIQSQISDEQYQQLSLQDKITYITNEITQTQNSIQGLEIQIAANNIQITMLNNDIQDKEDSIAVMKQEISVLEQTVNQRVTETYKYSFLSPFDLILDSKSFSDVLSRTKYLIATRAADVASLEDYSQKATALKREEDDLAVQQTNLQSTQDSIVAEKSDLDNQNKNLQDQMDEKNSLLAQSEATEAQLMAAYQKNLKQLSDLDATIIAYVGLGNLKNGTYVIAGTRVGSMGNTGNSGGYHLHFSVRAGWSGNPCEGNIPILNYFTIGTASWITGTDGWQWPYMYPGTWSLPIAGPLVIMSQDYHEGDAIDLISFKADHSVNYGAPIYAIKSGTLYKATDGYGGVYAYIRQDDGNTSCYLHMQN